MGYKNFNVAVFCTVFDLISINDMKWFESKINFIEKHVKFNKAYLETFRSGNRIEKEKLLEIKAFFNGRGVQTSGAITPLPSYDPELSYGSFCYNNISHRQLYEDVVKYTAEVFDEIIIDDFFFTNCKCDKCIEGKKGKDWDTYRTELLKEFSEEIVNTAKSVNPNVNFIIKYPNWYEEYQNTGYNLKEQPEIFDMVYTGTETRDPENTQQHLQRYLSYFLMRYMENVKPGKNGGGWFDGIDCTYNPNSYAEQAYLTLFSKAKEVTLFCLSLLCSEHSVFIPIAGYAFDRVDEFFEKLGTPMGVSCYKPYHSKGENYLHNYIGMLGIPLEPSPEFSENSDLLFLTASAACDNEIIDKIKRRLLGGRDVIVTSGFIASMKGTGIEDIISFSYTGKKTLINKFAYKTMDCSFEKYYEVDKKIMIPQIEYPTNDVWTTIAGISENNNFPILASSKYGKGIMHILTIPDDFGDLYHLPKEILKPIREVFCEDIFASIDAESKVGLFAYDNDTFIVQSFLPHNTTVDILIKKSGLQLQNLDYRYNYIDTDKSNVNNAFEGTESNGNTIFTIKLKACTFNVYKCIEV